MEELILFAFIIVCIICYCIVDKCIRTVRTYKNGKRALEQKPKLEKEIQQLKKVYCAITDTNPFKQTASYIADIQTIYYQESEKYLKHKPHPAYSAAEKVSELRKKTREAIIKDQNPNVIRTVLGYAQINNIDFDIALTTETQEQTSSGISAGIRVFDIMRLRGENKDMNQNIAQCVSRVKFTIPVVYPHSEAAIQATLAQNKPQRPTYGEETNQNQSSL